jgi:hypothetical protein
MRKLLFVLLVYSPCLLACTGFLPPHDLTLPLTEKNEGLSEAQYHQVINKVENHYRPIVARQGGILRIDRKWSSPTVNAGTYKDGKYWHINLYGGMARHRHITADGYALVICHELGHHLGGAPQKREVDPRYYWSSAEGQADYFATLKCLRTLFHHEDNATFLREQNYDEYLLDACKENFKNTQDLAICVRTILAALAVSKMTADTRRSAHPQLLTQDQNVVGATYENHPLPQCRLDTYFQGSLCIRTINERLSSVDETEGSCHPSLGHIHGNRPLCWFRPK